MARMTSPQRRGGINFRPRGIEPGRSERQCFGELLRSSAQGIEFASRRISANELAWRLASIRLSERRTGMSTDSTK